MKLLRLVPVVLAGWFISIAVAFAASPAGPPAAGVQPRIRTYQPVMAGVTAKMSDIHLPLLQPDPNVLMEVPFVPISDADRAKAAWRKAVGDVTPDGALQTDYPRTPAALTLGASFQGVSQATQGAVSGFFVSPPDTVGDVGPNHYVQCVNLACQVFNKDGSAAGPVVTIRALFLSAGGTGDCSTLNDGDPIVNYDPLADRWILSQFAVGNRAGAGQAHECLLVSQTSSPVGAYYAYDFAIPEPYFNDYPKIGVWPDSFVMTAPLFEGPVFGQGIFAMNRAKMLAGDPTAEMIFFDLTLSHPGLSRILPADVDGIAPPAGAPVVLAGITANEMGDPQDGIRLLELKPDFSNPPASTLTELGFPGGSLAVAAFDPTLTQVSGNCGFAFTARDDIEQPPPATCGMRVDALSDRPMHRLGYRNFGAYESYVFTHTVDVNATPPAATSGHRAAMRYYELRRALPAGTFTVQEQATFSPDATHRFMGSAAMDGNGNIAVGYSVSDLATFPGVRVAGRLATDPPGGLFQGELAISAGGRSQTSTGSRWGDYSALSVDPADECTFWYTQEYYDPVAPPSCSATACWTTRIASFTMPGCVSALPASGTLQGTVTDANTATGIVGALVQTSNGNSALTIAGGAYSMVVPAGTFAVTASKAGYGPETAAGVIVAASGTTTQDFALSTGVLSGTVTDSVTTLAIAGALVEVSNGATTLTDGSGNYSFVIAPGTYTVDFSKAGYFPVSTTGLVVGATGTTDADAALDPTPGLAVTSTAVDDSTLGNNNLIVDPGECFYLDVTLTNGGSIAATSISAILTTTSPLVDVVDGASAYPDIAGGGTGTNVTRFRLRTGLTYPAGVPLALVLSLTTAQGPLAIPFSVSTTGGAATTFAATGPVAIPDNDGSGAALTIPVAGFTSTLSKVAVRVRITHTFDGDIVLRLRSPDNTVVLLAYQIGAAGAGFGTDCPADANDTTFDDDAATSITAGAAPFIGSFRPQQPLVAFAGKAPAVVNGNWSFEVADLGAADIGNIECVALLFNGTSVGPGCNIAPTADAGGPYVVDEGGTTPLSGSGFDFDSDPLTFTWDLDGDAVFGETGPAAARGDEVGATPTFSAAGLDGPSLANVTLRAFDGTNATDALATVSVANVSPTAFAGGPYTVSVDGTVVLAGSGSDPAGVLDPLTYAWDLDGDALFGETGGAATRGDEVGANPTFDATGLAVGATVPVDLQVNDGDSGDAAASSTVTVEGSIIEIPTLSGIGLAALIALMVGAGLYLSRRRERTGNR